LRYRTHEDLDQFGGDRQREAVLAVSVTDVDDDGFPIDSSELDWVGLDRVFE
jgi:hypothetical protein